MSTQVAANTLDYYAPRTDPDGPAMTDAIHAIDAGADRRAGLRDAHLPDALDRPFVRDPFAQFAEARGDKAGAQDPLAGSPGLQLPHRVGRLLAGLHLRPDRPALARGPGPPRPDAAAAALRRRDAQGAALARAHVRRRDRAEHDDGHAARRRAVHARVAAGHADVEQRLRGDPDPPARPHADGRPRPLQAGARRAPRSRGSTPRPRSTAARRRCGRRTRRAAANLTVDLGRVARVSSVVAQWTDTEPASSRILTSQDGTTWTERARRRDGRLGAPVDARYVRVEVTSSGRRSRAAGAGSALASG